MSYAVVCFLDEGEENAEVVQEVPLTWLRENNTMCLWPPTNFSYHIINGTQPTVSWKQHPIRCDRICDSLANARKRCTKETSSEDDRGRGQRRNFLSKHLIGQTSRCLSPPMPEYNNHPHDTESIKSYSHHQSMSEQLLEDSDYAIQEIGAISQQPVTIHYPSAQPKSSQPSTYQVVNEKRREEPDQNGTLKTIEMKIDKLVELLGSIKVEIDGLKNNQPRGPMIDPEFKHTFPFTSIDSLKAFEEQIGHDIELKGKSIKYFISIGGLSGKDFHTRLMSKIFTNSLAMTCSWKGFKNNHKIGEMSIMQCVYDAITQEFPTTLKEFEILTKDWLRHAKQRKLRE